MKNNILLFLCFISIFWSIGQNIKPEDLNFKLDENKKVIWEKNYDYEANKDSLAIVLKSFLKNNIFNYFFEKKCEFACYGKRNPN